MRRLIALILMTCMVILPSACSRATATTVPFIPSEYFNCTDVAPQALYDQYYACWSDFGEAEDQFDNTYIVFKNIALTNDMFKYLNQGNLWVLPSEIDCYLLNPSDMRRYKAGDKIDVVGLNTGPVNGLAGLVFKNCIILPAGSVQLPAPGSGSVFIPNY